MLQTMEMQGHKAEGHYIQTAFERVWEAKGRFFFVFFCIFMLSYGFLYYIDFIPETPGLIEERAVEGGATVAPVETSQKEVQTARGGTRVLEENMVAVTSASSGSSSVTKTGKKNTEQVTNTNVAAYPTRIAIDALGIDVPVLNPGGSTIAELDAALLKGAVRHPDSADFMNDGSMLIFGHSSYLPVIHNQNFKAFNGIQKLGWGDHIRVYSNDSVYTYRVAKVYKVVATEDTLTLDHSKNRLILVTCNSLGSKDDRFVVEADLIETKAL